MDTTEQVRQALIAWKQGDARFNAGDHELSVTHYRRALQLSRSLPAAEPFDHGVFEASCNAGLSGSLGRLGRHRESLEAANEALGFFDRALPGSQAKVGNMYPAESGKWLMASVNQGVALACLGRNEEALVSLLKAQALIRASGASAPGNEAWLATVEQNIRNVQRAVLQGPSRLDASSAPKRPWWRLWA